MSEKQSRLAGLTKEEIKAQMELVDGEGRELLTEEEQSSRHNISHNSDNGYLYQDADFLCGAIIKLRVSDARKRALLKKHEWVQLGAHHPNYLYCIECHRLKASGHKPDCALAAELKGE